MSSSSSRQMPLNSLTSGTSSAGSAQVRLKIKTADPGTEIYVVDSNFNLAGKGVSNYEALLAPGIYKLKVRAGYETVERLVVLFGDIHEVFEEFPPLKFSSPIPLANTANSTQAHMTHAGDGAQQVHVEAGAGSWIYVFARQCGEVAEASEAYETAPHPAQGLTMRNLQGELVADLSVSSQRRFGNEPSAACCVEVDPGNYRLRVETPSGLSLERMIVASEGWQTQLFMTTHAHTEAGEAEANRPATAARYVDLAAGAILLSRSRTFNADDPALRQTELARFGLTNGRKVVLEEMREQLSGDFADPLLGLYGAHLMLLKPEPEVELLKQIINRLRKLLGEHPDVEALALKVPAATVSNIFAQPPMLRQSWAYIVEATGRQRTIIPPDSLSARIATRLWGEDPWLVWSTPPEPDQMHTPIDAIDPDVRKALKKVLETQIHHLQSAAERKAMSDVSAPGGDPAVEGWLHDLVIPGVMNLLRGLASRMFSVGAAAEIPALTLPGMEVEKVEEQPQQQRVVFDDEKINELVHAFGIPRLNLEALLDEVSERDNKTEATSE